MSLSPNAEIATNSLVKGRLEHPIPQAEETPVHRNSLPRSIADAVGFACSSKAVTAS